MLPYDKALKERSQQLRKNMTPAEVFLWSKIRKKQVNGYWFYRQRTIGDYIVDFYCPKAKLAVEVDGGYHRSKAMIEYDKVRNEYLTTLGIQIARFTNVEVLTSTKEVIARIEQKLLEVFSLNPSFSRRETD